LLLRESALRLACQLLFVDLVDRGPVVARVGVGIRRETLMRTAAVKALSKLVDPEGLRDGPGDRLRLGQVARRPPGGTDSLDALLMTSWVPSSRSSSPRMPLERRIARIMALTSGWLKSSSGIDRPRG
jgi:hypothetical protein